MSSLSTTIFDWTTEHEKLPPESTVHNTCSKSVDDVTANRGQRAISNGKLHSLEEKIEQFDMKLVARSDEICDSFVQD